MADEKMTHLAESTGPLAELPSSFPPKNSSAASGVEGSATSFANSSVQASRSLKGTGWCNATVVKHYPGSWEKQKLIGAGADGQVFLATDLQTGLPIAVKELMVPDNQRTRAHNTRQQIEALRRLPTHQNVIQHHGTVATATALQIIMDFVPGGSIAASLANLGAFEEEAIRHYARQLCQGLAFLHNHGVTHRDIKGANCLLSPDGGVTIVDFGSCFVESSGVPPEKGIQGTAMWMAPEGIREEYTVATLPKVDIWGLGCTIVEMATGKKPWADAHFTNEWSAMFYISQAGRGPPIPPHLSRQAHRFLLACFQVDPSLRPSADECLLFPFIADEFDAASGNPDMQPPSSTELKQHQLPADLTRQGTESPTVSSEYASTIHSQVTFAVLRDDADIVKLEETPEVTIGGGLAPPITSAELGEGESHDPEILQLNGGPRPFRPPMHLQRTALALRSNQHSLPRVVMASQFPLPELPESADMLLHFENNQERALLRPTPDVMTRSDSTVWQEGAPVTATASGVRVETIQDYVRSHASTVTPVTEWTKVAAQEKARKKRASWLKLDKALLFNVLSFLDAGGLRTASALNKLVRTIIDEDSKERLWKTLFINDYGEVDDVRMTLRQNWKNYYRTSIQHRSVLLGGRYSFVRRLTTSASVFEGVDITNGDPIVIKLEVKAALRPKTQSGNGPTTPLSVVRSPSSQVRARIMQSTLANRGNPGFGFSTTLAITSTSQDDEGKQRSGAGQFHLSTAEVTTIASPPSMRTGGGTKTPSRHHHPANLRPLLPSMTNHPALPFPEVGALSTVPRPIPPTSSSSQSAFTEQINHSLLTGTGGAHVALTTMNAAQMIPVPGPPPPSAPMNSPTSVAMSSGTAVRTPLRRRLPTRGEIGSLVLGSGDPPTPQHPIRSGDAPWSELYEFKPTEASEKKPVLRSTLHHSHRMIKHLDAMGVSCVPRPLFEDTGNDLPEYTVSIQSALGPSLNELLQYCGNQLSMRTVTVLALKMLRCLEELHENDMVHGSITPHNIVVGRGPQQNNLFFINFSNSRFYRDPRTHKINQRQQLVPAGNQKRGPEQMCFASTFVQRGCTPYPRDDIISIGYVLCYLTFGRLPWISESGKMMDHDAAVRAKTSYLEELSKTPPLQLYHFLRNAYQLRQSQEPNYDDLSFLISRMIKEKGWQENAPYDWSTRAKF